MQLKDYEYYQKTSEGGCKSQMKDFINLYSKILKRVKKEFEIPGSKYVLSFVQHVGFPLYRRVVRLLNR